MTRETAFSLCVTLRPTFSNTGNEKRPFCWQWYHTIDKPYCCVSQAAIDSLTRSLALEWGTDYGIRCNAIAPGPIAGTPGIDKLVPEETGITSGQSLLEKWGEKWDIAMAAIFLASKTGK